jgi:hypothetical protein
MPAGHPPHSRDDSRADWRESGRCWKVGLGLGWQEWSLADVSDPGAGVKYIPPVAAGRHERGDGGPGLLVRDLPGPPAR